MAEMAEQYNINLKDESIMIVWVKRSVASILLSAALLSMSVGFAQTVCDDIDIDNDDDGLIEVCYLENLDAVRHVLDGSGYKLSANTTASTEGCSSGGCRGYELWRDLDFNTDDDYRSTANKVKWTTTNTGGWLPIGDSDDGFSGIFDGNGYTLSGLTIHTTANDYIGLFGVLSSSGTITRISLADTAVHGDANVGSLVGRSYGTIHNSHSSGRVHGRIQVGGLVGDNFEGTITDSQSRGSVNGTSRNIGGLAGFSDGTITNSYSRGSVSGDRDVGGLVGRNGGVSISNSGSSSSVSGREQIGGLVGYNTGTISNSYSRGATSGTRWIGGLVGKSSGTIRNSYSSGLVRGGDIVVGGLVGENEGFISNSYSRGSVSGVSRAVGGLVGNNHETISNSYSSSSVRGGTGAGGLVGDNHGSISNSYSDGLVNGMGFRAGGLVGWNGLAGKIFNSYRRGPVSGAYSGVGGLVGTNEGTISNSYSQGPVSGTSNQVGGLVGHFIDGEINNSYSTGLVDGKREVGGLVGHNERTGVISNSYWDITTSKQLLSAGGTSKTTAQLQAPTTASGIYSEWSEDDWYFGIATEYPVIKYSTGTDADHLACDISQQPACDSLLTGQGRVLIVVSTQTPVRRVAAMEGDILVLKAAPGHSIPETTTERRVVALPDLVDREATTEVETEQVGVSDGTTTHQVTVLVVVEKINNGQGVWSISQNGNDLTVALSAPDPDGAADASSISYQWQKCLAGAECSDEIAWRDTNGTSRSYSVVGVEAKRNSRFRVIVRYRDRQGYAEQVVASITYFVSLVSSVPIFTRDWSEFPGGAAAICNDADIDNDNDGLIEICHLEDLDAVRYAPDGSGYQPYSDVAKSTRGCGADGCNGYELVRDLDFAAEDSYLSTANQVRWTTGTGWLPISPGLSSTFDGNGYTLSGLMINRSGRESFSDRVGLFASLSSRGVIEEIGLLNVDVRGRNWVGGLVGQSVGGHIRNSYSRGSVSGETRYLGGLVGQNVHGHISKSYSSGQVRGDTWVGGLVGENYEGTISHSSSSESLSQGLLDVGGLVGKNIRGRITYSYSNGLVSGDSSVGGLVGENATGAISHSHSSGVVSGDSYVGGLVGENSEGTISNSHSSGLVSSDDQAAGGLVGLNWNEGAISNSYSSGAVTGNYQLGGLVGRSYGFITNSYSLGSVSGRGCSVGGLVGWGASGHISNSYSNGSVSAHCSLGGLVGLNDGIISNSYSRGSVRGNNRIGGLVGRAVTGTISNSYSSGAVTGNHLVGGLVGEGGGTVNDSFWDITTSRWLTSAGGTSKTTTQLQTPTSATDIYSTWSSDAWDFGTAIQYPALKYIPGPDANNPLCGAEGQLLCSNLLAGSEQRIRHIAISTETYVHARAAEGETLVLNAAMGNWTYQWEAADDVRLLSTTDTAELRLLVPTNLVERDETTGVLAFRLTVTAATTAVRQQTTVQIVVNKVDNGLVSQLTITGNENRLTFNLGTDPDGAATVETYQWQQCSSSSPTAVCSSWEDISQAASYSIPEENALTDNRFRVRLTYTDGQGYRVSVTSAVFTYQGRILPIIARRAIFVRLKLFLEGALQ